jgi:hypothetical protein
VVFLFLFTAVQDSTDVSKPVGAAENPYLPTEIMLRNTRELKLKIFTRKCENTFHRRLLRRQAITEYSTPVTKVLLINIGLRHIADVQLNDVWNRAKNMLE